MLILQGRPPLGHRHTQRHVSSPGRKRRLRVQTGRFAGCRRRVCRVRASSAKDVDASQVRVVLGTQWGDEGKGKLVDIIAQQSDVVCRVQGGANAGHTIYDPAGNKFALHVIPSGILNPKARCVIGNGVVVNIPSIMEELETIQQQNITLDNRLFISNRAHVLLDLHKEIDGWREAELAGKKIGTTKRGIGPAYASKANRLGLRFCDLKNPDTLKSKVKAIVEDAKKRFEGVSNDALEKELDQLFGLRERILPFVADSITLVNEAFDQGERILIEGGQATMLDIDFGTYPYVTSSNPSIGGCISGLGLAASKIGSVIGVTKAYTTRVGAGPYPTEIFGDLADTLRESGGEYGTTTGRPRRIGWMDITALNYASKCILCAEKRSERGVLCRINGVTAINLTKLDVLSCVDEIKIGIAYKDAAGTELPSVPPDLETLETVEVVYESLPGWQTDISQIRAWKDLPQNAQNYVNRIEQLTGVPCVWIGVGPERDAMVIKSPEDWPLDTALTERSIQNV